MPVEIPKAPVSEQQVFNIHNEKEFLSVALEVFRYQYFHNKLYQQFCQSLGKDPGRVRHLNEIPFLPISFFKTHEVCTGSFEPELVFTSSGTSGTTTSRHLVRSLQWYRESFLRTFRIFYGEVKDYCILALLPSYLERKGSSLVYMAENLIRSSGHERSGFYLHNREELAATIRELENQGQRTLLIGVTYALLDFAREFRGTLGHTLVMETGGMKGRSQEMTREELYQILSEGFGVQEIHAEYGMTELLSQAYARNGLYNTPPWMKVLLREETDPLSMMVPGFRPVSGAVNIIDLANIHSCSFMATDDLGKLHPDGRFEVLGRLDHADIRGCSLLVL